MKIKFVYPIEELYGQIGDYYFRNINGKVFACRRPTTSSKKQQLHRAAFGYIYGTSKKKQQ